MFTLFVTALAAEPGFDADGVGLTVLDADPRDPLFVERPGSMDAGDAFVGATLGFASGPNRASSPTLSDLATLHVGLGAALHRNVRVDLQAPLVLTGADADARFGPTLGDIRLRSMVTLFTPEPVVSGRGGPGLGIVGALHLPSGSTAHQVGWGEPSGSVKLAGTWELPRFTFALDGGIAARPASSVPSTGGLYVLGGASAGWMLQEQTALHLEFTTLTALEGKAGPLAALTFRHRAMHASAAVGLSDAPGIPAFRLQIGGSFEGRDGAALHDVDSEGQLTILDACPLEAEIVNGYRDDDGCPDRLAALSVDPRWKGRSVAAEVVLTHKGESRTEQVTERGLLLDVVPGSLWTAEARTACTLGRGSARAKADGAILTIDLQPVRTLSAEVHLLAQDGSPIAGEVLIETDGEAACVPSSVLPIGPDGDTVELGPSKVRITATAPGYGTVTHGPIPLTEDRRLDLVLERQSIVVDDGLIVLQSPPTFDGERLDVTSFSSLDELALVVRTELTGVVEIGAHTNNVGNERINQRLSRARAEAIRRYLIGKGVDPNRLTAVGYGPTRPIDTNRTANGRARNERIELRLLEAP